MDGNWSKVYDTKQMIRAEIAREKLEENGIAAVILDKKDSLYPVFGTCEVHVSESDFVRAQTIIANEDALQQSE